MRDAPLVLLVIGVTAVLGAAFLLDLSRQWRRP
jgi:hypothetical protein